ncbi:MAG: transcription antitermination factor NusB [Clostridia bacterium]|nr:transcription antitermination factor NusB [Clostridia bacterium]
MARSTARAAAMQLIYEHILGGDGGDATLEMIYENMASEAAAAPTKDDQVYISDVLNGVLDKLAQIDEKIRQFSKDWSLERMARVDLTILRLAVYELMYRKDVPGNVAISEAVELANQFSDPASSRFINGVLGAVLRSLEDA